MVLCEAMCGTYTCLNVVVGNPCSSGGDCEGAQRGWAPYTDATTPSTDEETSPTN
jgi:hypothetical protein